MKRVDLLLTKFKPFSFEMYVASAMESAFQKQGIEVRKVFMHERQVLDYLEELKWDKPSFTLSFSEGLSLKNFEIPHFYWEWRTLAESLHLVREKNTRLGFGCRKLVESCRSCGWDLKFIAPAVSSFELGAPCERKYDIVFFDNLIDTNCLKNDWSELFREQFVNTQHLVLDRCEKDRKLLPLEVIWKTGIQEGSLNDLLFSVEEYLLAQRVHQWIESIEGYTIHVFGEHIGNNWLRRLKNGKNVYLHSSLPYAQPYVEYMEILSMSKILVRDEIQFRDGCDEWIFAAVAHGCLPLMTPTLFLEETFGPDAPFFTTQEQLQELIHKYLSHPQEREQLVRILREKVMRSHTFEKRAIQLCE